MDFGRLDVMVANAGIPSKPGGLDDKLEDWHRVVDIDFSGAYYCAHIAGEIFRKQGFGNLIFTASMSGHAANFPQQQVGACPSRSRDSRILISATGLLQYLQGKSHSSCKTTGSRVG
jgi:NAD(P)-dependent dehydrogenase (short-subunit alcohol dehydrogenase family)